MDGTFSVKSAYEVQCPPIESEESDIFNKMWFSAAPSNVLAFCLRVFLNRVQTKDNLSKRGIIQQGAVGMSVLCSEKEENLNHLLFSCTFAWKVWMRCYNWIGIRTALAENPNEHYRLHSHLLPAAAERLWRTVWTAVTWYVWLHRNDVTFKAANPNVEQVLELIKFRSWKWLTCKRKNFKHSFYDWSSNPHICLGLNTGWKD